MCSLCIYALFKSHVSGFHGYVAAVEEQLIAPRYILLTLNLYFFILLINSHPSLPVLL